MSKLNRKANIFEMGIYEYIYRIFKSSWGIYVKIIAEITSYTTYDNKELCCNVCNGLWFCFADKPLIRGEKFLEEDKVYLIEGLKRVSHLIVLKSPHKSDTLVVIHSIGLSLCDFQEEGLSAAIIEWAASALGFEAPKIDVLFNKEKNRYEFNY